MLRTAMTRAEIEKYGLRLKNDESSLLFYNAQTKGGGNILCGSFLSAPMSPGMGFTHNLVEVSPDENNDEPATWTVKLAKSWLQNGSLEYRLAPDHKVSTIDDLANAIDTWRSFLFTV